MVYFGPSRGCHMCRKRRIKCDESRPACKRCIKSRIDCPGYRKESEVIFRDENRTAQLQATGFTTPTKHVARPIYGRGDGCPSAPYAESSTDIMTLHPTPQWPIEEQAACHFISNFVPSPEQGSCRANMEFLFPLLKMDSIPQHFKLVFETCALASLNNWSGTGRTLDKEVLEKYNRALSATFSALRAPDVAKQDATLASVLLLSLFEQLAPKSSRWAAWGSHAHGAIQLEKARGSKLPRTNAGLGLLFTVRSQLLSLSLFSSSHLSLDVDWGANDAVGKDFAFQCQQLCLTVGELKADFNRLLTASAPSSIQIDGMFTLLRKCQAHETVCDAWAKSLPDFYQSKTALYAAHITDGDYAKAEVFPGPVDTYQGLFVANMWNMMRSARLIQAETIMRCVAWISSPRDHRTTPEYLLATRTCSTIIADIIASVPYQLGWFSNRKELLEKTSRPSAFGCGEDYTQKGLGGYNAIVVLSCAIAQDYTTTSQRTWMLGRLQYIGTRFGIKSTHNLAKLEIRAPSMLIRQDSTVSRPCPRFTNFDYLLSREK